MNVISSISEATMENKMLGEIDKKEEREERMFQIQLVDQSKEKKKHDSMLLQISTDRKRLKIMMMVMMRTTMMQE